MSSGRNTDRLALQSDNESISDEWVDAACARETLLCGVGQVYIRPHPPAPDMKDLIEGSMCILELEDLSLALCWTSKTSSCVDDVYFKLCQVTSILKDSEAGLSNLTFTLRDESVSPTFYFRKAGYKNFLYNLSTCCSISRSSANPNLLHVESVVGEQNLPPLIDPRSSLIETEDIAVLAREVNSRIVEGLARVSFMARKAAHRMFESEVSSDRNRERNRGPVDAPCVSSDSGNSSDRRQTCRAFVEANLECPAVLYFDPNNGLLAPAEWASYFDGHGRCVGLAELRRQIYFRGVSPELRPKAWRYLLKLYGADDTDQDKAEIDARNRHEYTTLNSQWASISDLQESRFEQYRERKHRIEKDVIRTDRSLNIYKEEDGPALKKMENILLTYSFFNFDLGYVQGMSDLLSPILFILDDEIDAFRCFANYMETMRHNFSKDQNGIQSHLACLRALLKFVDRDLHDYLEMKDALDLFFCYRWILVNFKREFPYEEVLRMWEAIWANDMMHNHQLFLCLAIIEENRDAIMGQDLAFDDIIKFFNECAGHHDVVAILRRAHLIHEWIISRADLPSDIKSIIHTPLYAPDGVARTPP